LPALLRPVESSGSGQWPLAAAALVFGLSATLLAVLSTPALKASASSLFQLGASLAAGASLGWAAARTSGRERTFWSLVAAGPMLWAVARLLQPLGAPPYEPIPSGGGSSFFISAAADLCWVAALLVRPDRAADGTPARLSLTGFLAAVALAFHAYIYLLVLPAPFAVADGSVHVQIVVARIAQRGLLAAWVGVLCTQAATAYWRGAYGRLAVAFAVW